MKKAADRLIAFIALAVVALMSSAILPHDFAGPAGKTNGGERYYHPGKVALAVPAGQACLSKGCHEGTPHKRGGALAPFRNMHAAYVDCPVCHAADGLARFEGRQAGSGQRHLRYTGGSPAAVGKGHPPLGAPAGCRRCHSDAGTAAIKGRGLSLPSNFSDPIALRMHEGGGRRWNP